MAFRTPRDEREWRAMVERGLRENRSGIRAAVDSAVGAIGGGGGGGTTVDTRHPTAPIELTYQTSLYLSSLGRYQVRFILDFPNVTKATDGTDITVAQYELWGKPVSAPLLGLTTDAVAGLAAPGVTLPGLAATPANKAIAAIDHTWTLMATSVDSAFRADGFEPGTLWDFRARAIGFGLVTPGNWSTVVQVQMVEDNTPPSQPSAPILSVNRGTITARWDGMAVTGAMPADFRYVILAHGTDTSPTMEIARFGRGGGFKIVADIPYFDPQFFRLKAVDESGNESPWSEQAVAYTSPLVDKDVILSTIDGAVTHLRNIDAGVSILPNSILTEHLVVTEEMTARLANFLHVRTDMLDANEIWADEIWVGLADAILVRADMFEGKAFTGGTFTGTLFQTDAEALTGLKIDFGGLSAWNSGGELTVNIDAFTGSVDLLGTFQIGRDNEPNVLLNKDIWGVWPGIRFKVDDPTPPLDYHPTLFAVSQGGAPYNWGPGDFVMLGSQTDSNESPRSDLRLGGRGGLITLGRTWSGTTKNEIRFESDGAVALLGHLKASYTNTTFKTLAFGQTAAAAGYFTQALTPPPVGAYWPTLIPDGVAPISFVSRNVSASGFEMHFSGPANNATSFHGICTWRP